MYSPKIKEELVREIYKLKEETRRPMTKIVNEAVEEYLRRRRYGKGKRMVGSVT
ncbi:MAG: hypothetical protein K9G63_20270 [Melioribacteraceae bacterium]|nr:hypothetical protein [Melioribacteraceae bacterium]